MVTDTYISGHGLPALVIIVACLVASAELLRRMRQLSRTCPGSGWDVFAARFCELYIPERNKNILTGVGVALMCTAPFGFFLAVKMHQVQVGTLFSVGVVFFLEGKNLVPPDSGRAMFALYNLFEALQWNHHGHMKENPADGMAHIMVGNLSFALAAASTYSILNPNVLGVYLLQFPLVMQYGVWLITTAWNKSDKTDLNFSEMMVGPWLGVQTKLIITAYAVGLSMAVYPRAGEQFDVTTSRSGDRYSQLPLCHTEGDQTDDDDEDD